MTPTRAMLSTVLLALVAGCGEPADKLGGKPLLVATGLPLFLGEGGVDEILNGTDQRAGIIRKLSERHALIPVEVLNSESLKRGGQLLLIQPKALSGEELVALDGWVRSGGRVLVFADPFLAWPSELPVGDARRAPPVTLLDPLLAHWGLVLDVGQEMEKSQTGATIGGLQVQVADAGQWKSSGPACRLEERGLVADCVIGEGRAILVADADLLDARRWTALGDETADAVLMLIERANRPIEREHNKNER